MQEGMHACQALAFHLAASCFAPYSRNHCQCRPASALKLVGKTPNSRVQTCRFPKADVRYKHWATLIIRKEAYGPPELPRLNRLAPQLTGKSAPQAPLAAFGASGAGTALRYKRQAYKDLALYGVDEADFDFVQQLPASRQKRIQAVGKVGGKSEGGSVQSLGTSSVSEQKGIGSKHSESADSRGWLAYLLLSCDERTTLVGVTNDLSRRYAANCHACCVLLQEADCEELVYACGPVSHPNQVLRREYCRVLGALA